MNSDIKVSVVIPTYNREKTISYCLKSVLAQTYPVHEIIIVDDGSKDNTVAIVKTFDDSRIKLIQLPCNQGAQAARNAGIRAATGDYIAFLDSDDTWLPEKLEIQIKEIGKRSHPCIVYGDAWVFIEEKNEKKLFNVPKLEGNVYEQLLDGPGPLFQCILAPRESFEKINYLDEKVPSYQEWDTSIALSRYYEFVFIDQPLFTYYLHSGETISKNRVGEARGWEYIVKKYEHEIKRHLGRKSLAKHFYIIGSFYHKAGRFDVARKYFFKAYMNEPANLKKLLTAMAALLGVHGFEFMNFLYGKLFRKKSS
jgi:glycosyltransferase involved in cell wall biosynthesis